MDNTPHLVSNFVSSLETHPNGKEIIAIIEDILADDSGAINPALIASLKTLSDNNLSLLVDFWFLRASIFKEEGRDLDSVRIFFEAIQWRPDDESIWFRITDFFQSKGEFIKAFFFLTEAQKRLGQQNSFTNELNQLKKQLEAGFTIPPGYNNSQIETHVECLEPPQRSTQPPQPSTKLKESLEISPEALDLWNQALECFEEGTTKNDIVYLQAFIHYAHSTIRKVLGLDGNFKAGLDRKIAQYGLFSYEPFFIKLNRLRNAVIHDDYILSEEESKEIHGQITDFLAFIQKQ
ncbi:MAG: hypothetical protein ACXADY_10500 [Candidatus Hodarchaeales archaeon]|jgi:tetratricopeptide (TPR) repeat protein